jgi:hypothetical protein
MSTDELHERIPYPTGSLVAIVRLVWPLVAVFLGLLDWFWTLALVLPRPVARLGTLAVVLGRFRLFSDEEQVAGHSRPLGPPLHRRA